MTGPKPGNSRAPRRAPGLPGGHVKIFASPPAPGKNPSATSGEENLLRAPKKFSSARANELVLAYIRASEFHIHAQRRAEKLRALPSLSNALCDACPIAALDGLFAPDFRSQYFLHHARCSYTFAT
jgi:hypothetical protein